MNADQERLKMLLTETISLLCQRGLTFRQELHVQGLLGITVDGNVFLVPINERTSNNVKQPFAVNYEREASSSCDSNPQQHYPAVHQVAPPRVPSVQNDAVSAASSQTVLSPYPAANKKPDLSTVTKTDAADVCDIDSGTDDETQMSSSRPDDNFTTSEPVNEPVLFEHMFPTAALGVGNSTTFSQVHSMIGGVKFEEKRKRRPSTFGDDMLILSPENDQWTNVGQTEDDEPVAGCSQWPNFGEEPQSNIAVSIFEARDLSCSYFH